MNKFIISLSLILVSVSFYSQNNGYIEYDYVKNLGTSYTTKGVLYFSDNNSSFIELKSGSSINKKEYKENSKGETILKISNQTDVRPEVFFDTTMDSLYSLEVFHRKPYLIGENIPKIDWSLTDETKKIDQFECQKATANFRGRFYTVWFTKDIPVGFGPWKLNGLPGLILEAKDSFNQLYFFAKKIVVGNTAMEFIKPKAKIKMTLREYVLYKEKFYGEKEKIISSKLPRNASFQYTPPSRSSQKEIVFEWEK